MDSKRQLTAIKNRDWSSKTQRENAKYLRNKLDMLGYKVPSYMRKGQINEQQLEFYANRIMNKLSKMVEKEENFETSVEISVNAYIPEYYIENEEQRLEIYKKISLINSMDGFYDVQEEIEDRFGTMPSVVQKLLDVAILKSRAHSLGIVSIAEKQKNIVITFKANAEVDTVKITKMLTAKNSPYMFTASAEPYITIKTSPRDKLDVLGYIKNFLDELE